MKKFSCLIALVILIPLLSGCVTYVHGRPPRPGAVWVERHPDAHGVWVEGYWR